MIAFEAKNPAKWSELQARAKGPVVKLRYDLAILWAETMQREMIEHGRLITSIAIETLGQACEAMRAEGHRINRHDKTMVVQMLLAQWKHGDRLGHTPGLLDENGEYPRDR